MFIISLIFFIKNTKRHVTNSAVGRYCYFSSIHYISKYFVFKRFDLTFIITVILIVIYYNILYVVCREMIHRTSLIEFNENANDLFRWYWTLQYYNCHWRFIDNSLFPASSTQSFDLNRFPCNVGHTLITSFPN